MSRFHSYINSAKNLIETYKGEKPFAVFLKQFFAVNKKYGSKDRRYISSLCYNYFRMGFAGGNISPEQKMLMATFLCETAPTELLENLQPEWNSKILLSISEKLAVVGPEFSAAEIFPFQNELGDGIDKDQFCLSFLVQPGLFIRIRPQTRITLLKKLEKSKLPWQFAGEDCVRLTISDKVEDHFIIDKEVVVQDYNSQKVLDYLKSADLQIAPPPTKSKLNLRVWDCCAASGGKSILLKDIINRKVDLTVSDVRPAIILILHQRFKKAGIKEYKYFIADITTADPKPIEGKFDLIICDAPCTGSGTWSRTPEQLCFFKQTSILEYSNLQKKIVANTVPCLQTGGLFVYITCSVFKNENEQIASFIAGNFNCQLLDIQLLKGYDKKADSMFVAVFRKV
ncbi:MAG: Fmu (Sun) protein [Ferruginibacter sp.]|nr:Fmu (Sun) protein [Ferruginibacter sp.]